MTLLTTTTVTVRRPADGDPYETATTSTVASGVPAHISQPTGSELDQGGQLEQVDAVLLAGPGVDLLHTDLIVDAGTGNEYRVAWVRQRQGVGLDHTKAGLVAFEGAAAGG